MFIFGSKIQIFSFRFIEKQIDFKKKLQKEKSDFCERKAPVGYSNIDALIPVLSYLTLLLIFEEKWNLRVIRRICLIFTIINPYKYSQMILKFNKLRENVPIPDSISSVCLCFNCSGNEKAKKLFQLMGRPQICANVPEI